MFWLESEVGTDRIGFSMQKSINEESFMLVSQFESYFGLTAVLIEPNN